jgi:hypothetical protein
LYSFYAFKCTTFYAFKYVANLKMGRPVGTHPDADDARTKYVRGARKRTLATTFERPKYMGPLEMPLLQGVPFRFGDIVVAKSPR